MADVTDQEYSRYQNRLVEVEDDTPDVANDVSSKQFAIIIGVGVVAAVVLAVMLSLA
jgi:hypothetical protein